MSLQPSITFVSAFLDLCEDRSNDKSVQRCMQLFRRLAQSKIRICVFASKGYIDMLNDIASEYPNIYVMPSIELSDTWTYKATQNNLDIALPNQRTSYHDTYNFLTLMNAKVEFVQKAIELDPFHTSHFAWIDFSICHVIHSDKTLERLYTYSVSSLRDTMLLFPGCWTREYAAHNIQSVCERVHWRFCGGFFVGDKESIQKFNECYHKHYDEFLKETGVLVWEVNFWEWLEYKGYFQPEVYIADHNDTIVNIPSHFLKTVACLTTIPPRFKNVTRTIYSLLDQVDHVYVAVSKQYERFGEVELPDFSSEEAFRGRVSVVESEDYGPVTKYLGALPLIQETMWMFICDDDQEYHPNLIRDMKMGIHQIGVYQNRYHIVKCGSGGLIHGYVGNLFHRSLLARLPETQRPSCSRFVDDQYMSAYCFLNKIPIFPTSAESYSAIFAVLNNGYEQIGEQSLASIGNRDPMIADLAKHFGIVFKPNGEIDYAQYSEEA